MIFLAQFRTQDEGHKNAQVGVRNSLNMNMLGPAGVRAGLVPGRLGPGPSLALAWLGYSQTQSGQGPGLSRPRAFLDLARVPKLVEQIQKHAQTRPHATILNFYECVLHPRISRNFMEALLTSTKQGKHQKNAENLENPG